MLAFAMLMVIRHKAEALAPPQKSPDSKHRRWSAQEIRRVAWRLAQNRIEPAFVIAWSAWRQAHQAMAQKAHLKRRAQL
jgi:hypothetical protein